MAKKLENIEIGGAILGARGNIEAAAKALKCSKHTIYNRIKKIPELDEAREAARVILVDAAEDKLFEAVTAGKPWAVELTLLKTKIGRSRGYGASLEIGAPGGGPLALVRDMTDDEVLKRAREIVQ